MADYVIEHLVEGWYRAYVTSPHADGSAHFLLSRAEVDDLLNVQGTGKGLQKRLRNGRVSISGVDASQFLPADKYAQDLVSFEYKSIGESGRTIDKPCAYDETEIEQQREAMALLEKLVKYEHLASGESEQLAQTFINKTQDAKTIIQDLKKRYNERCVNIALQDITKRMIVNGDEDILNSWCEEVELTHLNVILSVLSNAAEKREKQTDFSIDAEQAKAQKVLEKVNSRSVTFQVTRDSNPERILIIPEDEGDEEGPVGTIILAYDIYEDEEKGLVSTKSGIPNDYENEMAIRNRAQELRRQGFRVVVMGCDKDHPFNLNKINRDKIQLPWGVEFAGGYTHETGGTKFSCYRGEKGATKAAADRGTALNRLTRGGAKWDSDLAGTGLEPPGPGDKRKWPLGVEVMRRDLERGAKHFGEFPEVISLSGCASARPPTHGNPVLSRENLTPSLLSLVSCALEEEPNLQEVRVLGRESWVGQSPDRELVLPAPPDGGKASWDPLATVHEAEARCGGANLVATLGKPSGMLKLLSRGRTQPPHVSPEQDVAHAHLNVMAALKEIKQQAPQEAPAPASPQAPAPAPAPPSSQQTLQAAGASASVTAASPAPLAASPAQRRNRRRHLPDAGT